MGRNLKNLRLNWMTRIPNGRRTEALSVDHTLKTFSKLASLTPLKFSTIEFHLANQELKIIISGTSSSSRQPLRTSSFAQIYVQEISEDSLKFDPRILAKAIASDRNHRKLLGSHIWTQNYSGTEGENNSVSVFSGEGKGQSTSPTSHPWGFGSLTGIRIEIKGIAGKMTMSKKIIKTFGTLKFNSSSSIINFGEARSLNNQRGLIGVKVWIATKGGSPDQNQG